MKKFSLLLISMLSIIQLFSQHKLMLRPSLGNGKPTTTNHQIFANIPNVEIKFDKYYGSGRFPGFSNRVLQNPQIGFMLEYNINKNNIIGFGWVKGRTEANYRIRYPNSNGYWSGASTGAIINKTGFEYTRNFFLKDYIKSKHSKMNRLFFSALIGGSIVNHRFNNYECCQLILLTKDVNGVTIDSTTWQTEFLNYHGLILTGSLRVGLLNRRQREKLSLTFSYDYGFHPLWKAYSYSYSNYLQEYVKTTMVARGSQFKIYVSMPLTLYDFDKQKLQRQAKRK